MRRLDRAILVGAPVLGALLVAEVAFLWWLRPEWAQALMGLGLAQIVFGREAGIPTALAAGAPPLLVLQVSAMMDLATGGTAYGIIMVALHRRNAAARKAYAFLRAVQARARSNRTAIERWGPPGAFLIMLVPFLVNGPLVVASAGRLAGLKTRQLIAPIVAATFLSTALWIVFSSLFLSLAAAAADQAIWIVPIVCALAAATVAAWKLWATLHAHRASRAEPA